MGVAHLLGRGAPELTTLAGAAPLLEPCRLAMIGGDPREIDLAGRQFLAGAGVSYQEGPALAADPVGVAKRALAAVTARSEPLVAHLDVDVVDSGDLPLGNFPHYGSGVLLEHVVNCLGTLLAHQSVAGLVLTEVNPTHDGDGTLIQRYLDGLVLRPGRGLTSPQDGRAGLRGRAASYSSSARPPRWRARKRSAAA